MLVPVARNSSQQVPRQQLELEQLLAKNQVLPEVDLSLLYRWVGVGDELGFGDRNGLDFPAAGSSALGELTGGNYQEAAVRLDIQPAAIGMRRELTRVRGTQLELARGRAFLQEQERLYVSQLSDAVAKTLTHYQLVQTNAQRWQAAEQEVQARLAEYQGGRTPVNVVLQSQQRRAQAQIDYYRSLAEYNKSINFVHATKAHCYRTMVFSWPKAAGMRRLTGMLWNEHANAVLAANGNTVSHVQVSFAKVRSRVLNKRHSCDQRPATWVPCLQTFRLCSRVRRDRRNRCSLKTTWTFSWIVSRLKWMMYHWMHWSHRLS